MSMVSSLVSNFLSDNSDGSGSIPPKVYLQNNGNRLEFPVPPSSFEIAVRQNNTTININNIGELNMIGKTGLMTMSFVSFFPNQQYSFCTCQANAPYSYVKTIDSWRTSGKPCRFIISDTPVNYAVTIDGFKWGERDGTGDVYFSLDFKEYKFVGGAKDTTQYSEKTGLKDRKDPASLLDTLKSIKVYPGDSIGDVLGRTLGKNLNLGASQTQILTAYKSLAKGGGIQTGDALTYAAGLLKVNGKNVDF